MKTKPIKRSADFLRSLCALGFLYYFGLSWAEQLASKSHTETVKLLCDFKDLTPYFFEFDNGDLKTREDSGIEEITPTYNKFVATNAFKFNSVNYLFGYFLSIHDVTEKIAPNPVGTAYVKRDAVVCINLEALL